jgi:hypothetical protein
MRRQVRHLPPSCEANQGSRWSIECAVASDLKFLIASPGLAVSSFPAKRLATAESRFGDVADVPQLPLPEKFAADCKGTTNNILPSSNFFTVVTATQRAS